MHRTIRRERTQIRKIRRWMLQLHHQRAIILRLHPDFREISQLPFTVRLRIDDHMQQRDVISRRLGVQHPLPRSHKIMRRHRLAIAPTSTLPQPENITQSIRRNLRPRLRYPRN